MSAARSLFSERTFLGASMNDIARAVGMTKGALYHHFASKTELFRAVIASVTEEQEHELVMSSSGPDAALRLRHMIEAYVRHGLSEQRVVAILGGPSADGEAELRSIVVASRARLYSILAPTLAELGSSGLVRPAKDARGSAPLLIAMLDGLILSHHYLGEAIDPVACATQVAALFTGPVRGTCL